MCNCRRFSKAAHSNVYHAATLPPDVLPRGTRYGASGYRVVNVTVRSGRRNIMFYTAELAPNPPGWGPPHDGPKNVLNELSEARFTD